MRYSDTDAIDNFSFKRKQLNFLSLLHSGAKVSYVHPRKLANHDLVLCTYQTLKSEFDYLDLPHANSGEGRRFRNPKRYNYNNVEMIHLADCGNM